MDTRLKAAFFIDGANLYATARALNFDIDYGKVLKLFSDEIRLIRSFYYTALLEGGDYQSIRPLIDWLDYNGFQVVSKPAKEFTNADGTRKIKGNMDCEMIVDMFELAPKLDVIYLWTGDGDFTAAVMAIQRQGVEVKVISTIKVQPPMIADELRRNADQFIDLHSLQRLISRVRPDG